MVVKTDMIAPMGTSQQGIGYYFLGNLGHVVVPLLGFSVSRLLAIAPAFFMSV